MTSRNITIREFLELIEGDKLITIVERDTEKIILRIGIDYIEQVKDELLDREIERECVCISNNYNIRIRVEREE